MCPLAVMWYNLFSVGCLHIENYFFFMHSTFFTLPRILLVHLEVFFFCDARRLTLNVSHFILLFNTQNHKLYYHKLLRLLCRFALVYFVTKHTINITRHLSCVMRKPTFWFPTWSDTNQAGQLQKMARGLKFWIKKVKGLDCVCSENKGADQLRSYCEADLRLCFRICQTLVFSLRGSFVLDIPGTYVYQDCGIKSDNVYHKLCQNKFHPGS